MGGDEDSSDSGSVGSVLEEVLREKGKTVSLSVRQRLRSASRVLRDQSSSDAAALLCDAEAIDSVVTTQDSGNFPGETSKKAALLFFSPSPLISSLPHSALTTTTSPAHSFFRLAHRTRRTAIDSPRRLPFGMRRRHHCGNCNESRHAFDWRPRSRSA